MVKIRTAVVQVMKGGRITIPQEIRDLEDIIENDYLTITIEKEDRPEESKK
jgi:AbrB family looped-hinge helix DNA binding protein